MRADACLRTWLLLVALTLASFALAEAEGGMALAAAALGIAVAKGQALVDHFMGLRRAPGRWRGLLAGWLIVVGAGIAAAYLTA